MNRFIKWAIVGGIFFGSFILGAALLLAAERRGFSLHQRIARFLSPDSTVVAQEEV